MDIAPISELAKSVYQQMPDGRIDAYDALICLKSINIVDREIGYNCFTDPKIREGLINLLPNREIPILCLRYLLDCVSINQPFAIDAVFHTRPEALWELKVPMDDYWRLKYAAIEIAEYWEIVEKFLTQEHPIFISEFVTHFLEGVERELCFESRVNKWKADPLLSRYLTEYVA